jgi:hypothetical protein
MELAERDLATGLVAVHVVRQVDQGEGGRIHP